MTQRIAKVIMPKILMPKKHNLNTIATGYLCIYAGTVVFCTVVQPDYRPEISFRRNLYEGFKTGLLIGALWPIAIPLCIDRIITDTVNSDPIRPKINAVTNS
jgi:hypothetical protein